MKAGIRATKVSFLLLLFFSIAAVGIAALEDDNGPAYSVLERAFWQTERLTAPGGILIFPGLKIDLTNVTIPADGKPEVTFRASDNNGGGLDREGKLTPGPITFRFVLAYIPSDAIQYVDYITRTAATPGGGTVTQASTDSTGKWTNLGDGSYMYKFNATLPANYDKSVTHTLCVQATRDLREFELSRYVVNELKTWVPNGSAVTKIRDVVPTASCNQCHDPISAHGGGRIKNEYCILCHTPQTKDGPTGNTADMKVMVHKIHRGPNLPSVVAGKPYYFGSNPDTGANFSHTTYPQDIRNCATCHKDAKQVNNWLLNPTRDTCGSCHDDIDWVKGTNHIAGAQADDKQCASCHQPQGEAEYDASISGAHIPLYRSSQLVYPKVEITGITSTAPGQKPTVTFKITDKKGQPINPATLAGTTGRIAVTIAGPTTDYRWYLQEAANNAVYANGVANYSFTGAIPATATGTYAAEVEGRIVTTLNPGPGGKSATYQESWPTAVKFFTVTDKTVTARRNVVDLAKCNKCHDKLQLHGSNRNTIEACVICHNPATTDMAQRTAGTNTPAEAIDMKIMIHKIHTGEELAGDYTVYGFGKRAINFNEVLYPGDRRDCLQCHLAGTYTVPLPSVVTPSTTPRGYWDPTRPTAAACLGCHDSIEAAAHAYLNTASIGEACAVCHKESAEAGVSKVHAR